MTFTPEVWEGVLRHLKNEVPEFAYKAWLEPVHPKPIQGGDDGPFGLLCPSQFHCERIRKDFLPRIKTYLRTQTGGDVEVHLGVATDRAEAKSECVASSKHTPTRSPTARAVGGVQPPRNHLAPVSVPAIAEAQTEAFPEATHTFESFVVGSCNALAREVAWALAHGQQRGLSQIYLQAKPGMGKTHLAKAVVTQAMAVGDAPATYISAEGFT
ncbi:MAG: DnaA/Hda family protein, partial [Myxococcota bacterium]|nr:DnaA/Hda family protein [Myxococcota bacterium]